MHGSDVIEFHFVKREMGDRSLMHQNVDHLSYCIFEIQMWLILGLVCPLPIGMDECVVICIYK